MRDVSVGLGVCGELESDGGFVIDWSDLLSDEEL